MSTTAPETSHSNYLLSIVGALGSMLLFFFILWIAYIYMFQPTPVNQQTIDNRLAKRAEVESKQKALTNEYAWINQKEGTVRVPVELAMQLAVNEIKAKPEGIFPAAEPAPAVAPAPEAEATPSTETESAPAEAKAETAAEAPTAEAGETTSK